MEIAPQPSGDRYCVIGAGSSGLAAARHLRACGIAVDVLEREDDLGGNWCYGKPCSSVYNSVHTISSKRLTEFNDFPMPEDFPAYPHHTQVLAYLRSYARRFNLYDVIQFRAGVDRVERTGASWRVVVNGLPRDYAGLIVANGHNWRPRWPEYPGEFSGLQLHSAQYKTPDILAGKRVLVVGGGNSGCDIAVEAGQWAARCLHSVRRGYYYVPKFLFGKPSDEANELLLRWRLPQAVRRWITRLVLRVAVGPLSRYGLPKPDHPLFHSHPIINSQLLYSVGHGRIVPKPDVRQWEGNQVRFVDGSVEEIDVAVLATGFHISFPFLADDELPWRDGRPDLYLNVFHPQRDNLFALGLIQPDSGQFGLVDLQAQLTALFIAAQRQRAESADWFRRLKENNPPWQTRAFLSSPRHALEVEHFSYRRALQKLIARFEAAGPRAIPESRSG